MKFSIRSTRNWHSSSRDPAAFASPIQSMRSHCRRTEKIGCTAQTLNEWVKKTEVDAGKRAGVPSDVAEKLKALERENRELRQANEILRKASAYFAQAELDRPFKR